MPPSLEIPGLMHPLPWKCLNVPPPPKFESYCISPLEIPSLNYAPLPLEIPRFLNTGGGGGGADKNWNSPICQNSEIHEFSLHVGNLQILFASLSVNSALFTDNEANNCFMLILFTDTEANNCFIIKQCIC